MTALRFKQGISVFGLQPEMLWALDRCVEVWRAIPKSYVTVTSARGGAHSVRSLHYVGHAVDLRSRDLNELEITTVMAALPVALGPNFDILFEGDHFHIEYQPENKYRYPTEQPFL